MNLKTLITIASVALLTASCTRQYKAERLAADFIERNALHPEEMSDRDFKSLDSTKHITDSIILSMQARGGEQFQQNIDYPVKTAGRMLYYLRMSYVHDGDTLQNTFYLDEELQNVVSFK
ncbi:MAG: hypothetical protein IJV34_01215 [Prevotella sp.]|nr:hypothetical protein [Prevotella sp.]